MITQHQLSRLSSR